MDDYEIQCSTCGVFQLPIDAWELYAKLNWGPADRRFLLSARARTALVRGEPPPRFTQKSFVDAQAGMVREPRFAEKRDALLRWIEHVSREEDGSAYGAKVTVDPNKDYPVAWCRPTRNGDWGEWNFLMGHLLEQDFITTDGLGLTIKSAGWEYLESRPKVSSSQGFIAMAFKDMGEVHAAIAAGIEAAGYEPLRIDGHEFVGGIMDEIQARIRESRFVVADLTQNRGGVYHEAGFALGLGIPVIPTVRQDHLDGPTELRVHFDVQHLNLIPWTADNLSELTVRLKNRIEALFGHGPLS